MTQNIGGTKNWHRHLILMMNFATFKELHKLKICPRNGKTFLGNCIDNEDHAECHSRDLLKKANSSLHIKLTGAEWYKVTKWPLA